MFALETKVEGFNIPYEGKQAGHMQSLAVGLNLKITLGFVLSNMVVCLDLGNSGGGGSFKVENF